MFKMCALCGGPVGTASTQNFLVVVKALQY